MDKSLNELNVLITGASRGIGPSIAIKFASMNMNVVIHYKDSHEKANEVARKCLDYGGKVLTVSADLRYNNQIERMKIKLEQHQLLPDILVNNAGVSYYGLFSEMKEEEWDEVMAVNLKGLFLCTRAFMPSMLSQKFGRIINVSSIWGITGASCEVAYSTSKGGMNTFTKALAKELAPSNITVNAVAPGVVDTDMMNIFSADEKSAIEDNIPMGRFAYPSEIASLVYFLSLPESGYITGQIISPNGGWLT